VEAQEASLARDGAQAGGLAGGAEAQGQLLPAPARGALPIHHPVLYEKRQQAKKQSCLHKQGKRQTLPANTMFHFPDSNRRKMWPLSVFLFWDLQNPVFH